MVERALSLRRHCGKFGGRATALGPLLALASSLAVLAPAAAQQQPARPAAAAVRQATPAEVRARLDAEAAAIAAEPAFDGLDKPLSHYIRSTLPGWAPLGARDAAAAGAETEPGQPSPFICKGDFDGNGLEDAAVVMREQSTGAYRVMAFHQITITANPSKIKYRGYETHDVATAAADASPEELTIACNGPGSFEAVEGDVTLTLKHDSIEYADALYYFIDGAYRSLVIGD